MELIAYFAVMAVSLFLSWRDYRKTVNAERKKLDDALMGFNESCNSMHDAAMRLMAASRFRCGTCGRKLQSREGGSIVECPEGCETHTVGQSK